MFPFQCFGCSRSPAVEPFVDEPFAMMVYVPNTQRVAIRNMVKVEEKSLEEVYIAMLNRFEEDLMEYTELEYWYYQSRAKEPDIFKDRREDYPKLMDFKDEVLKDILWDKYFDDRDRLKMSQVCRRFQKMSPELTDIKRVDVYCHQSRLTINYNGLKIEYKPKGFFTFPRPEYDHLNDAIEDIVWLFMNPWLRLDKLTMEFYQPKIKNSFLDNFRVSFMFTSTKITVRVKEISMKWCVYSDLLKIVPHLTPGFLQSINVTHTNRCGRNMASLRLLSEMEQWKQAKCLGIQFPLFKMGSRTYDDIFTHFKQLRFFHEFRYAGDIQCIRIILKTYTNLDCLLITSAIDLPEFCKRLSWESIVTEDAVFSGKAMYPMPTIGKMFYIRSELVTPGASKLRISGTYDVVIRSGMGRLAFK